MAQRKRLCSPGSECKITITFGNGVEQIFHATTATTYRIRSLILGNSQILEPEQEVLQPFTEIKADRISLLPDEILVLILSLLSSKEAITTSILSRRWRYLSRYLHNLNLDGMSRLMKPMLPMHFPGERSGYIRWVDEVISMNKSPTLEQFRLAFNLDGSNQQTIDQWVRFALSRRVQKLELDFTDRGQVAYQTYYVFPAHNHHITEFKFLTKLFTKYVSINGEFVKELVQNCRHLQHLSITMSNILNVEIVKPSPSFKCLEIRSCRNLVSLVIRDSNIATLKVLMTKIINRVVLENVPLLSEFWCFADPYHVSMAGIRFMFSSVLPQLRIIKLYTFGNFKDEDTKRFSQTVELSNLKQLVVAGCAKPLGSMINLLNSSPQLERFVVELLEQNPNLWAPAPLGGRKDPKKYYDAQFEMVMHLVEHGVALQKIKVDPRIFDINSENCWEFVPQQKSCHDMAHRLMMYVPSTINLEIL